MPDPLRGGWSAVLNIGKLAVGGGEYYLEVVATGIEDYYLGAGEAPGYWTGASALHLGLSGTVHPSQLQAVLAGDDPISGGPLRAGHGGPRLPGFDLTFRAPKSVSLLWGLADPDVSEQVRDAHDQAVHAALTYLESQAAFTRRGAQGRERIPADGLVAAAFRHRTSRAGDPLLHTHVLIANLAHTSDDDRWRTVDGRQLYRHAKTAGYLYQAVLRHELTIALGVAWQPVVNGTADIHGIPRPVIEHFSQRRTDILNALDATGHTSAKAAQAATLATRQRKEYGVTTATLYDRWRTRASAVGLDDTALSRLLYREVRRELDDVAVDAVTAEFAGADGLTAYDSTFARRDVIRAWAERLPRGGTLGTILRLADTTLADPNVVVRLPERPRESDPTDEVIATLEQRTHLALSGAGPLRDAIRGLLTSESSWDALADRLLASPLDDARDPVAVLTWRARLLARDTSPAATMERPRGAGDDARYSTPELLRIEMAALEAAVQATAWVSCDPTVVDRALQANEVLAAEQAAMVRHITVSTAGVQVVVGPAGTGKTTALAAAVPLWQQAGCSVIGTALAARTAQQLGDEASIPAVTLERLLGGLRARGARHTDVIVVDEAGMVDTRTMTELIDHTTAAGARLILVGDHRQLPEIRSGGLFAALTRLLDPIVLRTNRRQQDPEERVAVNALREGPADHAVRHFTVPSRHTRHDTHAAAIDALVTGWWADRQAGMDTLMLASSNADVDALNAAARRHLAESGHLYGSPTAVGDTVLQVGDDILCLINDPPTGVFNGTTARIDAITDGHIHATTIPGRSVAIPHSYATKGGITHAYATTVHKAQGRTLDTTHVLLDDTAYREMTYVMLSRHRHRASLHVCDTSDASDDAHHPSADLLESTAGLERAVLMSRSRGLATEPNLS